MASQRKRTARMYPEMPAAARGVGGAGQIAYTMPHGAGDLQVQVRSNREREAILERVRRGANQFAQAESFKALTQEQQELAEDIVMTFTEFMLDYHGAAPEQWSERKVEACCLETFPRKVSADESYFEAIAPALLAFFGFLEEGKLVRKAAYLKNKIRLIAPEIAKAAAKPENWGLAKSIVMQAREQGVDMTNQEELEQFRLRYNESLSNVDRPQISRNALCPCGSGKKYKNCCGK